MNNSARKKRKYLFVSFSKTEWNSPWYVRQKLMNQLSKEHKVLYVNQRKELRKILSDLKMRKRFRFGVRKVGINLCLVESPWIFPKIYKIKQLDTISRYLYYFFIKFLIHLYGRNCTIILYIWEPHFFFVPQQYLNFPYIYHPYDCFEKYTYSISQEQVESSFLKNKKVDCLRNKEYSLVKDASLFYSVSETLCDYYFNTFGRRPKLLPNAVHDIYFDKSNTKWIPTINRILAKFPRKKIAFSGRLVSALDLDIVIKAAGFLLDYDFLFIGPLQFTNIEEQDQKLENLLLLKNVFQIGPFNVELLPQLLRMMDIFIIIYSKDKSKWTHYSGPAKLFEYMAIGKPIISTPHPAINNYCKYIWIVEGAEQFVQAVRDIETGEYHSVLEEMVEVAKKNTWENRVSIILNDILNLNP